MPPSLRWDIFCRVVDNFGDAGISLAPRAAARARARHRRDAVDRRRGKPRVFRASTRTRSCGPARAAASAYERSRRWRRARSRCPTSWSKLSDAACRTRISPRWRSVRSRPSGSCSSTCRPSPGSTHRMAFPPLTRRFRSPAGSGSPASRRRPAACPARAGPARDARRIPRRCERARDDVAIARRHATRRCAQGLALLLRKRGVAGAARVLGRRRRAGRGGHARKVSRRPTLDRWTGGCVPHPGAPLVRGRLTLAVVPFVDQDAFDRRLWASDLNIVRGEDSFVRAQWAGQPYVWHIYPQDGDAHLVEDGRIPHADRIEPAGAGARRAAHVLVRVERGRPGADRGGVAGVPRLDACALRPVARLGARAGPPGGSSRRTGQVLRKSFIIMGFPNSTRNRRAQVNLAAPKEEST